MGNNEKLVVALRYLADTPSYTAFHSDAEREKICKDCPAKGEFCYGEETNESWCMYEALSRAACAIEQLQNRGGKA